MEPHNVVRCRADIPQVIVTQVFAFPVKKKKVIAEQTWLWSYFWIPLIEHSFTCLWKVYSNLTPGPDRVGHSAEPAPPRLNCTVRQPRPLQRIQWIRTSEEIKWNDDVVNMKVVLFTVDLSYNLSVWGGQTSLCSIIPQLFCLVFFPLMGRKPVHSLVNILHQRIADFIPLKPLQLLTVMLQSYGD